MIKRSNHFFVHFSKKDLSKIEIDFERLGSLLDDPETAVLDIPIKLIKQLVLFFTSTRQKKNHLVYNMNDYNYPK